MAREVESARGKKKYNTKIDIDRHTETVLSKRKVYRDIMKQTREKQQKIRRKKRDWDRQRNETQRQYRYLKLSQNKIKLLEHDSTFVNKLED
jgi:hypothetical protein